MQLVQGPHFVGLRLRVHRELRTLRKGEGTHTGALPNSFLSCVWPKLKKGKCFDSCLSCHHPDMIVIIPCIDVVVTLSYDNKTASVMYYSFAYKNAYGWAD